LILLTAFDNTAAIREGKKQIKTRKSSIESNKDSSCDYHFLCCFPPSLFPFDMEALLYIYDINRKVGNYPIRSIGGIIHFSKNMSRFAQVPGR